MTKLCLNAIRRLFLLLTVALGGVCSPAEAWQPAQNRVLSPPDTAMEEGAARTNVSGTVVDDAGRPVAGASVQYWGYPVLTSTPAVEQQTNTGADGRFVFQGARDRGFLVARKAGLAPFWQQMGRPFIGVDDTNVLLTLSAPTALAGVVVDEAGKPVPEAGVVVTMAAREILGEDSGESFANLTETPARECFSARTDHDGHFRFDNWPSNVTAALTVKSPGKALKQSEPGLESFGALSWQAGQEDIKLVVEPAGIVEGKINVAGTSRPPPVASVTLQFDPPVPGAAKTEPVESGRDGVFRLTDVPAGAYRLNATFGTNQPPDWVAEGVAVTVESGRTTHDVQLTVTAGGFLEATVLGESDQKPMAEIRVTAAERNSEEAGNSSGRFQASAVSDKNGRARLRLVPGDYQVYAVQPFMGIEPSTVTVEAGATNRVEISAPTPQRITGVVRAPDGRPAAGAAVRLIGGTSAADGDQKTDADGRFEFGLYRPPSGQGSACVLARDENHNLAAAQEIDEDSGPLDLTLEPGLTLFGRVESNGKAVTNARARLIFWTDNMGTWLSGLSRNSNTAGYVEIPALPPGRRYGLVISARGYGEKTINNLNTGAAGRQEIETVELPPATLHLSGQVFDDDGKPAAGCYVNLSGEGQPTASVRSDRNGRFDFAHVCDGTAQISANGVIPNGGNSFGNVSAEGGDTNVVVQLGQNSSIGANRNRLSGTITDLDGKPAAGVQVAVLYANQSGAGGVRTGTNGAYKLTWSFQQQWQSAGPTLIVRDTNRNLVAVAPLDEDTTNLDAQLEPALTLTGRIQEPGGTALAGASVEISLKDGNSLDHLEQKPVVTDKQGRYELRCLPPDAQFTVFAAAKNHSRVQQQVTDDAETNRLEIAAIELKPARLLVSGQVLDENDKPVAGANVSLSGTDQPNGTVTTDRNGDFHFKVCEGTVQLNANNNRGWYGNIAAASGDTNVVLRIGQNMMAGSPLHHLEGKITDPDGKPAVRATVSVLPSAFGRAYNVKTGSNGEYHLTWSVWPPGQLRSSILLVRGPARNLAATAELDEDTTNLDARLKPALTLLGGVNGTGGLPLAGAQLDVSFEVGNTWSSLNDQATFTDGRGRYQLKCLPPGGQFLVSVSAKDHRRMQLQIEDKSGTNRVELTPFVLKTADLVVAGQVVDEKDKPIAGANVSIYGADQPSGNMTTDRRGGFRFKVCEGTVGLSASDNRGVYGNISVHGGDTNLTLRISRNNGGGATTHRLVGRITDEKGNPVAKALVTVFPSTSGGSSRVRTGSNGEYRLGWSLWAGQAPFEVLLVRDSRDNLAATADLQPWMTNLDAQLKPALTLSGHVETAEGKALPGAQINLMLKTGDVFNSYDGAPTTTDGQGRYEIKYLPSGRDYTLTATAKGHSQKKFTYHHDPETNEAELAPLVLKTADRVVAGRILDQNEKPVAGASVTLSGTDQPAENSVTDEEGRFRFQVCDGKVNLVSSSQLGFIQAAVDPGDTNIELMLTPPGGQGRVVLNGQPLPNLATVNLAANDAPSGKPVLLCLFDAGKPASRQVVQSLAGQLAALWQKDITVVGVQTAAIAEEDFRSWKTTNLVVFPVGRVVKKSDSSRWATGVPRLPWLILTDGNRRVISEGFTLDKLDAQIQKLHVKATSDPR